jgi:hypothetical protein
MRSSSLTQPSAPPRLEGLEDRCVPTTAQFVTNLYQDLLGRTPPADQAAYWINVINTRQATPAQVAQQFVRSDEFLVNQITIDYQTLLGRTPAGNEVGYWLSVRRAGLTDRQEEVQFLASDEFFLRSGGTPQNWLSSAFVAVLGRPPLTAEQNLYLNQGLTTYTGRLSVANQVEFSLEADARVVDAAFVQMLDRSADTTGLNYWTIQLQRGLDSNLLLAQLAASREYVQTKSGGVDVGFPLPLPEGGPFPNPITLTPPLPLPDFVKTSVTPTLPPTKLNTSAFVTPSPSAFGKTFFPVAGTAFFPVAGTMLSSAF